MKPFDFVNDINQGKVNLMRGSENDKLAEESYVPYLTNMALSMFPDTVLYANEMNMNHTMPNRAQYEFLLNSVRPGRRFGGKWPKKVDDEALEAVCEFFNVNTRIGRDYLNLMSPEQIEMIKQKQEKGGNNGRTTSKGSS